MSADRTKTLHQAQLYASKGQYDAAIAEWKKLAVDAPNDGSIQNSIGDLYLKRNANTEAVAAFLQAAAMFRTDGATLKAIAAYKKVLKIDPTRYEVYRHLGDLNAERGLLSSAVQDYLTVGKHYLKEGRGKDALDIYRKIVEQDPANLDAQQRVAELCIRENQQDEATKVYLQLGRERSAQGRFQEAKDAYLAVLRIDPQNSEAQQFVDNLKDSAAPKAKSGGPAAAKSSEPFDLLCEATRRINEKQFAGAEAILNQLLTREPGNPKVCQLLARLHLQRGDMHVALGEYRFLAGAALRAQELQSAESLITEFLNVQPHSVPMLELAGELHEARGDGAAAAQYYAQAVELLLDHPEPGMESLHEELFEKAKALSTDRALIDRLAARIAGEPVPEAGETAAPVVDEPAVAAQPAADEFTIAGAEPDDVLVSGASNQSRTHDGSSAPSTVVSGHATPAANEDEAHDLPMPASIPELCQRVESAIVVGQYREAEVLMARWLSQEPNNAEARELLGRVYEVKGDAAGAALQYARALELLAQQAGPDSHVRCQGLFDKVKLLAPSSAVLCRLADAMAPAPEPAAEQPVEEPVAVEPVGEPVNPVVDAVAVDTEAHYSLGVAYKNMGLYQEAIEEFQVAMDDAAFYLDACLMMALCYKEEQQFANAICMLEPVLFDPRCESAKGQAIRYELGLLYEAESQWEDAAKTYRSIPAFHDADKRLADLRSRRLIADTEFRLAS